MSVNKKLGFLNDVSYMFRFARKVMRLMSDLGMFLCCHLGSSVVYAHVYKNDHITGVQTSHDT